MWLIKPINYFLNNDHLEYRTHLNYRCLKNFDYQLLTYGVDFASCLKERNAINSLLYHLGVASNISSLTYQVVYAGKSTHEVEIIHNNAVDVVQLITSCIHALTDSGSMVVDILLLLLENRCFRSLIDNPLWKISGKTWTSTSADNNMIPVVDRHRGYYTSHSRQGTTNTSSSRKPLNSCQIDSVHATWREVIQIFSILIRSARYQVEIHANIDEHVMCQLNDVPTAVLDFICAYEDELLSCFSSMSSEARTQVNLAGGKAKSSTFASIQSSSFAFTPNLLKESADISSLFAELCRGETKILFANKCSSIFKSVLSTSLELAKLTSSFLGSVGNARELFLALSNASAVAREARLSPCALLPWPLGALLAWAFAFVFARATKKADCWANQASASSVVRWLKPK